MSGVDEQGVPQCPCCERCHEFRVGGLTWMFPENTRMKRQLKYSLYTRWLKDGICVPMFSPKYIICVGCNVKYFNNHEIYIRVKRLFDEYIRDGKYYTDGKEFRKDDRLSQGMSRGDIFERNR